MAADEMIRLGIPKEKIVVATAGYTEKQRTFESAVAVWRVLRSAGILPKAVNIFTFGPHARRSVEAACFRKGLLARCERRDHRLDSGAIQN